MAGSARPEPSAGARRKSGWTRFIGPAAGILVLGAALYLLHGMAEQISIRDIHVAIRTTPTSDILLSVALTAISFMALAAYDVLAVRSSIAEPVALRTAAFAGAAGYAVSNALGFPIMTGGSVRYRIYAASGLNMADISRVVTIAWATFWLGAGVVIGLFLAADPAGIAATLRLPPEVARLGGIVTLAAIAGFVVWVSTGARVLNLFGWTLAMPDRRTVTAQIAVGAIDMVAAGLALYVLLPAGVRPEIGTFAVVYTAALTLGILSHTPGGIGVFEATIISGLGLSSTSAVVGSLILYRAIYYVLPLIVAAVALAVAELARRRRRLKAARDVVTGLVPPIAGGLVFLGGIMLLISIALPHRGYRLDLLSSVLPQPFVEASHLAASVVGVLLLVIARGLVARLAPAWNAAMVLMVSGAVFSLVKGFDWEEATVLLGFALLLAVFHDAFYRAGRVSDLRPSLRWLTLVVSFVAFAAWLGFFFYRHVEYSNDLWWDFAWEGNASRFLRALFFISVVVLIIGLDAVINRPRRELPEATTSIPEDVRRLAAVSPRASAALALLRDKYFLMTEARQAFLMYGISGRSWIAMGDPVGDKGDAAELVWRFRELADRHAGRLVFYSASADYLPLYIDLGLSLHKIGEVARVPLGDFGLEGPSRQELRYVDRRASKEGLAFEVVRKAEVPDLMDELRRVSDIWLATRKAREKSFSLGSFEPDYLAEFDIAVMRKEGRIVAFANLWQSGGLEELSIDLMRYEPGASKILMDALFVRVMLWGKAQGFRWFNMGAAPLAGLATRPLAPLWNRVGSLIFRHGEKFYPFEGLRNFKDKFSPVWQPQYLVCRGGAGNLAQVLIDVAALVAGGRLEIIRK